MNNKNTYCNPLALESIPRGKDFWYENEFGMFSHENKPESLKNTKDYRSISDPTLFYYDNKWYLYPSYGMCWYTEDFKTWKYHKTEPYCPKYSPCIIKWKDDKFLLTSWICPLYYSTSPLGPFIELGDFIGLDGEHFRPCDPAIFKDDDDRIYLYAFDSSIKSNKIPSGFISRIVGYELDYNNPRQVINGPIEIMRMDPHSRTFERQGLNNQDIDFGWIEGPHMLKVNKRYYLIYACPDTCDASYVNAAFYSDESPLYGFKPQKHNPVTESRYGLIRGAGHGSIEKGPNNTLYCAYTIAAPHYHMYERRIGLDLIDINEDGELYAPKGITSTPQFIPGLVKDPVHNKNDLGYLNLTEGMRVYASSEIDGHDALYATDSSPITYYLPKDNDNNPWIECKFNRPFIVGALRLWFREANLDYSKGITPRPIKYILEGSKNGIDYFTLFDNSNNLKDMNIDYQTFDEEEVIVVRLRIIKDYQPLKIGLIDFSIFGKAKITTKENE